MKQQLQQLLQQACEQLVREGKLPAIEQLPTIQLERPKQAGHGDFASNLALLLAKQAKTNPRQVAEWLIAAMPATAIVKEAQIAGPGFINFFLQASVGYQVISDILAQGEQYGRCNIGQGKKVLIEFVSSNPTGPLHVGHGRGAAYGSTVANILAVAGFDVHREYYVNDAGRQMDILATSVWLRYLLLHDVTLTFPSNGYRGDYIVDMAKQLDQEVKDAWVKSSVEVFNNVPDDEPQGGDKEAHIDGLVANCKVLLGEKHYEHLHRLALETILADIKQDLAAFGVEFEHWYCESELVKSGAVKKALQALHDGGYTYTKDQAIWFKATEFGDDKDRVMIRENGEATYFANDIAYHFSKYQRGFQHIIDIFGADHHGYVARIKGAMQALGHTTDDFAVLMVQFAILYRGKERVQMSTRSGSFVTLRELREEVSNDAARFFYVMRKAEQHLDFDLELAKSQSNDNPVYYIQYAHARICSVFRQLADKGYQWDQNAAGKHLHVLSSPHEKSVVKALSRYPDVIIRAAKYMEPHTVVNYCRELATAFHSYYNAEQVLVKDEVLRNARLNLLAATQQVFVNALRLLGVSAPEKM